MNDNISDLFCEHIILQKIVRELLNNSPPNLPNIQSCIK